MAKKWVIATQRGQAPDGRFRDENSLPFEVDAKKVSDRWMKVIDEKEAKARIRAAGGERPEAVIAELQRENDQLRDRVAALEEEGRKPNPPVKDAPADAADRG